MHVQCVNHVLREHNECAPQSALSLSRLHVPNKLQMPSALRTYAALHVHANVPGPVDVQLAANRPHTEVFRAQTSMGRQAVMLPSSCAYPALHWHSTWNVPEAATLTHTELGPQ